MENGVEEHVRAREMKLFRNYDIKQTPYEIVDAGIKG
jgi:hypothetical protein